MRGAEESRVGYGGGDCGGFVLGIDRTLNSFLFDRYVLAGGGGAGGDWNGGSFSLSLSSFLLFLGVRFRWFCKASEGRT